MIFFFLVLNCAIQSLNFIYFSLLSLFLGNYNVIYKFAIHKLYLWQTVIGMMNQEIRVWSRITESGNTTVLVSMVSSAQRNTSTLP